MKRSIHILLLMLMVNVAIAQSFDDNFVPKDDKPVVGAIGSTVDITALGGASYTIPIQIPDGINGMQPNVSINYNSQSGNGLLGWGWNMVGTSAITRIGQTLYHDGQIKGVNFVDDRFALDGQRLLLVNNKEYGDDGAEYRTEIDGMSKIVSYSGDTVMGPACFKVWLPNGNIAYYGYKKHTRIELQQHNDVCMWMLDSIVDRNGNYVAYRYEKGTSSCRLKRILYTGNANANLDPCFCIDFSYEDRTDVELSFIGNSLLRQAKLLTEIQVKDITSSSFVLWKYDFNYDSSTEFGTALCYNRLKSIDFSCDGKRYYPTIINWHKGELNSKRTKIIVDDHIVDQTFSDLGFVKFTGDFNGDGYTDVISSGNIHEPGSFFHVYINKGKPDGDVVHFTDVTKIKRDENLDWIYVGDFNGDGLDDFMCVNRDRSWLLFDFVTLKPYLTRINSDGTIWFEECESPNNGDYWLGKRKELTMVMGDFLGNKRMSFIFQTHRESKRKHLYIFFEGDDPNGNTFEQKNVPDLNAKCMRAADFDGDGITEIWCTRENDWNGYIFKLTPDLRFETINNCALTNKDKVFIGDFNGDGHADFLSYNENDNNWKIRLWRQNSVYGQSYDITNLMPIGDPGDHGFSIFGYNSNYKAVEVADFNGDGKTDIAAVKIDGAVYDRLVILYAPFTSNGCAYTQEFGLHTCTDIQVSVQKSICVGNFLGKENVSLFCRHSLFSLIPITHRYGVTNISDGMGNTVYFEYKYLMPNKRNPTSSDFYQTTYNKPSLEGDGCFVVSLPLRGVSSMSSSMSSMDGHFIFEYENAIIHNKGRGFLGFETIWSTFTPPSVLRPNTVHKKQFSRTYTGGHHSLLLEYDSCFIRLSNTEDPILSSVDSYNYEKKTNKRNRLVYMPLQVSQTSDKFDVYNNGQFLNRKIVKQFYETDVSGVFVDIDRLYINTVHCRKTIEGIGLESNEDNVNYAPFRSISEIVYKPENYSEWIINRPYSTKATNLNVDDPSNTRISITTCDYDDVNPYNVFRQTVYPEGRIDSSDPFATYVENEYDEVGNVTYCTSGDLLGQLPVATTTSEYYPNYRQLKKQTNQAGYETSYTYDQHYGYCNSITDCKGLVTQFTKDPMGTNGQTIYPDGIITNHVTNWTSNWDEMKPADAKYYTLTHSSSGSDAKTYYDNKGRKLREVTYGFNGEPICVDTKYYSNRLVDKVSEPFFFNDFGNERYTDYHYDPFLRNDLTKFPDGTSVETSVAGFTTTTTHHPKPDSDSPSQVTSIVVNKAGWTIESVDANGTSVHYHYYPDGKLKCTQIGEDETTRVSMEYDDAGNRTVLTDPNYGTVNSVYNAYSQLCLNTDPKGNTTEYHYDNLGRNIVRIETNAETNEVETTNWLYDIHGNDQLDYIQGEHQSIQYKYDQMGRVLNVAEKRDTYWDEMTTRYEYDDYSRVKKVTYPTSYVVKKEYNERGFLTKITDRSNLPLWETLEVNEFGQIRSYKLGDNIINTREFDDSHRLKRSVSESGVEIIQSFSYEYDDFSNLASRTDNKRGMEESFLYDDLNRLTTITTNGVASSIEYDDYGRIISKQANGQTVFDNAQYQTFDNNGVLKPHAISGAEIHNCFSPNSKQTITYTMFDKVSRIVYGDFMPTTVDFVYGFDHQRISMSTSFSYGQEITKHYDGNCEFLDYGGSYEDWTYISGPLGVFALNKTVKADRQGDGWEESSLHYIFKDHLGSWTTITDDEGSIEQEQSFDAWGNPRNPETWLNESAFAPMFGRGFTGHEHLHLLGNDLINMNGRMYDPVMSSFLSVDNYVQQPDNSQNFNRYAYCLNNPLKYTDPSGEFVFEAVMSGVVLGLMSSSFMVMNNNITQPIDVAATFLIGAASGAIGGLAGYGAGALAGGLMSSAGIYNPILVQGVCGAAGGFAGGFAGTSSSCWMQGASFGDGLLAGLKSGGIGCLIGGGLGALQGGMQVIQNKLIFRKGCLQLGIEPTDPVPMEKRNDAFLRKAQKVWFPDAPMEHVRNDSFTVEDVPDKVMQTMKDKGAAAATMPLSGSTSGKLNGNSVIYFNGNKCFDSARDLFYTMGHEFVHVSQFAALAGLPREIYNNIWEFHDMLDYHAWNYQYVLQGDYYYGAQPNYIERLYDFIGPHPYEVMYFDQFMHYKNFSWTSNFKFVEL